MRSILKQKIPFVLLIAWCIAMFGVRVWYAHSHLDAFLVWNLGLAVVPEVNISAAF